VFKLDERMRARGLVVRPGQPLIGIPFEDEEGEGVVYFAGEPEMDEETRQRSIQVALDLAGAWSHMDWDEMERELDRIRHESKPTPPITDL
jgi:hypothetical protein